MRDNTIYSSQYPLQVEDGLDFISSHFKESLYPRKIMTKDLGYQIEIFNKQEALEYFKSSRYEDCRINAYPPFTEYHGINRTPISFLMVDIDLKDFSGVGDLKKEKLLEKALNKALAKIKASIGGAEEYFTDYTADRLHKPTVKSCLLRIPGSLNSKCIPNKEQDGEVRIIQKWDSKRPPIKPLLCASY